MKLPKPVKRLVYNLLGQKTRAMALFVTKRCDLDCDYCGAKDSGESISKELKVKEWKKIADKLVRNGHRNFIVTGGEPLMYKGIYDLIDHISKNALVGIITNANLLNRETFPKLKNLDYLNFSIDTIKAGKYHKKSNIAKLGLIKKYCSKYGIKPYGMITITSRNCTEVTKIIRKLDEFGIQSQLCLIHSNDSNHEFRKKAPEHEFKEEDIKNLMILQDQLLEMKKENKGMIFEDTHFIKNMVNYARGNYQINCAKEDPFFSIDSKGMIKFCHDVPASEVNALDFDDYEEMKKKVAESKPKDCNCYWQHHVMNR